MNRGFWLINIGGNPFADYTDCVDDTSETDGSQIIDEQDPTFGASKVYFARGDFSGDITFSIVHDWDTNADAVNHWLTGQNTWGGVADVLLTHLDYTNTETIYKIAGAKLVLKIRRMGGLTTETKLTITGGPAVEQ